jgi:hypothetical protein
VGVAEPAPGRLRRFVDELVSEAAQAPERPAGEWLFGRQKRRGNQTSECGCREQLRPVENNARIARIVDCGRN